MARGRTADKPTEIPAKGWKDIAFRLKDEISEDHISLIAAGVAFYGLLALFPAITALIAISGLLVEPNTVIEQLSGLRGVVPEEVITIVTDQATAVAGSREGGLGLAAIFGLLLALYSASKGMASLMEGINVAYDEEEERGFIRLKLVTFGLTLFLMFGLVVALLMMLGLPAALAVFNFGDVAEVLTSLVSFAVLLVLTMIGLAVLYRYGPSRDEPEWNWASAGAVIGCILWLIASAGFAFYVSNFGSYNESFGTLAGVIVLLMWFWISAFIILLGAELNAEMEAQTRKDTTEGQDLPMGQRDAEKADNLGEAAGK
ncbi:YihY/virulence factor BrkB family protein [Gymnodinialimonas ceratoperidinii]|uniref:YihY/virulence factor BrkB family protein n=1 Tax=Gymnodinialimonas ceratoperidinii TaxID=2856823 RepID=A0A8F6TUM6_9RHOB|nr:YihY/virulence factor BrkB family protein [Gymnodinialimonas ceratoperidinii]QXT38163.1 YihY/virulence factor BrkB family protein [Gymnodinialimonas ceratoperidinii]